MDKKQRFFPYQVPICECEHSQLVHSDSFGGYFHGKCNTQKCKCKKFTWTAKFKIVERRVRDEEIVCMGNELLECLTKDRNCLT